MLMPLLIVTAMDVQNPLDRFDRFATVVESLSFDMDIQNSQVGSPGLAQYRMSQPNKAHFAVKWGPTDYSFTMINGKAVEFDRSQQTYFEYDGKLYFPTSGFYQAAQDSFPIMFATRKIRRDIPGLKPAGKKTVDGQTGDAFSVSQQSEDGPVSLQVVIGQDGRLLSTSRSGGGWNQTILFKNYKVNEKLPASTFTLDVPAGYSPLSTNSLGQSEPLVPGSQAQGEWISADTGKPVALQAILGGKITLVAFLGDDSPSSESIAALKELKSIPVVILTEGKTDGGFKSSGFKTYYDPSGKSAAALKAEGTPYFFLMDGQGRVMGSWFGYQAEEKASFLADIRKAQTGNAEE
jgi:hypothetical protein